MPTKCGRKRFKHGWNITQQGVRKWQLWAIPNMKDSTAKRRYPIHKVFPHSPWLGQVGCLFCFGTFFFLHTHASRKRWEQCTKILRTWALVACSDLVTRQPSSLTHSNTPTLTVFHWNLQLQCLISTKTSMCVVVDGLGMGRDWDGRCLLTPVYMLTDVSPCLISMGNVFGPQSEWSQRIQNVQD